jgi:hypothetical protein
MKNKINLDDYWQDIDSILEQLVQNGEARLPSLKEFNLDLISNDISKEMGVSTFTELSLQHKRFLDEIELNKYLTPKLFDIAKKFYNYSGKLSNQYHIARKVEPGNSKEMYRAHFDSHIFTIVFPLKIPNSPKKKDTCGELIYLPNTRANPKNEISNLIGKVYFKKYASKKGLKKLTKVNSEKIENFKSYRPLIFLGKTTLHTNYPVSLNCSSYRLTLLAHFFDDSPKYGIGNFLRFLRNR